MFLWHLNFSKCCNIVLSYFTPRWSKEVRQKTWSLDATEADLKTREVICLCFWKVKKSMENPCLKWSEMFKIPIVDFNKVSNILSTVFFFAPPFPVSYPLPNRKLQPRTWGLPACGASPTSLNSLPADSPGPLVSRPLFRQAQLFPASGPQAVRWLPWARSSIEKEIIFHDCIV